MSTTRTLLLALAVFTTAQGREPAAAQRVEPSTPHATAKDKVTPAAGEDKNKENKQTKDKRKFTIGKETTYITGSLVLRPGIRTPVALCWAERTERRHRMALEKELETYRRELPNLLAAAGKYVLIHGDEVAGVWDTQEDAVQAGDDRFGLEPFLVKEIRETEQPRFIPFNVTPSCPS